MRNLIGLTLTLVFLPGWVEACNIPVFRYALERWRPELYEFVIFHQGPLEGPHLAMVQALEKYAGTENCPSNFAVERVNVAKKMNKDLTHLWKLQKSPTTPWLVIRFPEFTDLPTPLYAGPLDILPILQALDSPARTEIARRLLKGETAVWVLVESGNSKKDDEAARNLQAWLTRLEKQLKLPDQTDSPKDRLRFPDGPPLKIDFSLLRVKADDPAEKIMVQMLLNSEEGLHNKEPVVFPVFGQGIALWALLGKGITEENVERSARFLVGPCSCEIKKFNPGVDLLMTAAWEAGLSGQGNPFPDPRVGFLSAALTTPLVSKTIVAGITWRQQLLQAMVVPTARSAVRLVQGSTGSLARSDKPAEASVRISPPQSADKGDSIPPSVRTSRQTNAPQEEPPLVSLNKTVIPQAEGSQAEAGQEPSPFWRNLVLVLVAGLAVLLAATALVLVRKKP